MIPRHRPPFRPVELFGTLLRSLIGSPDVADLEQHYRRTLDVKHAVWIPSARYAITRAIQAVSTSETEVVCPVFNCGAVHHAARETGRVVRFIDAARDSFLMDFSGCAVGRHAVVLSEMFGQRYTTEELSQPAVRDAELRIFDLAMGIPTTNDMHRMCDADITVLSFGLGKSLYAGWGGMALTHSDDVAAILRDSLNNDLQPGSLLQRLRWNAEVIARTIAHESSFYRRVRQRQQTSGNDVNPALRNTSFQSTSHEWHRPPTKFHLQRCHENLRCTPEQQRCRRDVAALFRDGLRDLPPKIRLPQCQTDNEALSHFSIRVPAESRVAIRKHLWDSDIDAACLFPFPEELCDASHFPNAALASREVLNLPISEGFSKQTVIRICEAFIDAVKKSPAGTIDLNRNATAA